MRRNCISARASVITPHTTPHPAKGRPVLACTWLASGEFHTLAQSIFSDIAQPVAWPLVRMSKRAYHWYRPSRIVRRAVTASTLTAARGRACRSGDVLGSMRRILRSGPADFKNVASPPAMHNAPKQMHGRLGNRRALMVYRQQWLRGSAHAADHLRTVGMGVT